MGTFRRGFYLISLGVLGFLFLFALSLPAYSAQVTFQKSHVGQGRFDAFGFRKQITMRFQETGQGANSIPRHKQIVPYVPKPAIRQFARSAIRGGVAGVALTGTIEGLGYLIDQATREVVKPIQTPVYSNQGIRGDNRFNGNFRCGNLPSSFQAEVDSRPFHQIRDYGDGTCRLYTYSCSNPDYPVAAPYERCVSADSVTYEDDIIDLDPSDWARIDDKLGSLPARDLSRLVAGELANAPISGTVTSSSHPVASLPVSSPKTQEIYDVWPELEILVRRALNGELARIKQREDQYTPTPEEQEDIDRSTILPPYQPPPPVELDFELPPFCTWAEWICRPFVATDHPEVPTIDLETPTYDSGLPTSASCPAPVSVVTMFGTWEISFQPACDLATAIRVPLIAISYLMAGFIVVGVRR